MNKALLTLTILALGPIAGLVVGFVLFITGMQPVVVLWFSHAASAALAAVLVSFEKKKRQQEQRSHSAVDAQELIEKTEAEERET